MNIQLLRTGNAQDEQRYLTFEAKINHEAEKLLHKFELHRNNSFLNEYCNPNPEITELIQVSTGHVLSP